MIGIVLAGGTGSRLNPLTKVTNKHLLPICTKPMIYYPIETLKSVGINEIIVVTGKEHAGDVMELLGSGKDLDVSFTYKVQDEPGGIAQALGLCEDICDAHFLVILGDNVFLDGKIDISTTHRCKLFLATSNTPERFGVPLFERKDIVKIIEKPKEIIGNRNYVVTGLYLYENAVFDFIHHLEPSTRGELEITDVNNWYISKRGGVDYQVFDGYWSDAGTFESLKKVQEYIWNHQK